MSTLGKTTTGIILATCSFGGNAIADDVEYVPASVYGISLTIGGGVHDFTDESMRDTTDPGGIWDVRGVLGTRSPVALEAAYVGTAQGIDARFGEETTATLVGTGLEGALRINILPYEVFTPYAFGGLGWKRYDVTGADFRTADTGINDEDTLLEVPLGGGLAYRDNGLLVDGRFTYRAAVGEDLVISDDALPGDLEGDQGALGMDNWSVSARVGFEF